MHEGRDVARPPPPPGSFDQRVILHGVTWDQYEAVLAIRGDGAGVRMAYLQGELELMSPSRDHESIKTCLARLVEAYAEERAVHLDGFSSMTLRSRPKERGIEPDECYEIDGPKEFPDLAIEVVWTSGGLDKLDKFSESSSAPGFSLTLASPRVPGGSLPIATC
jgi:Uma2 family endonuclease